MSTKIKQIYKEFALSLSNRHHFFPISKISSFNGIDSDTFMSLWDYDEEVISFVKENKTLSGYRGLLYMPDEFIFDVDGSNLDQAKSLALALIDLLDIPLQTYFSGEKGFHIHISSTAFKWEPCADLNLKVKHTLNKKGIYEYADPLVIDKVRLIRVPNTKKLSSGYWKVPVKISEINDINTEWLHKFAIKPRDRFDYEELETDPIFDVRKSLPKNKVTTKQHGTGPLNNEYVCIQRLMESAPYGFRHKAALTLGSHLRQRYPESAVRAFMEHWRDTVLDTNDKPFKPSEMEKILHSVYNANKGEGYHFGCFSEIKDRFCSPDCKIFQAKKSMSETNISDLEDELISFFSEERDPVDIGNMYQQEFPVYPGETVLLIAPPESMKSMLLLNWLNNLKKKSYFMEFEMSPRQIGARLSMIHNGWNEHQLKENYKKGKRSLPNMEHIRFDYQSCYPWEIKRRLEAMEFEPEVIFIDHCGLMKSRFRDEISKDKDISEGIMNLANDLKCVVIGVWELSKSAFHGDVNIAAPSGSFRVAYNANKILSLRPIRPNDSGIIEYLELTTIKNREQERMNCKLKVDTNRTGRIL
tara:strand:- start:5408 stop:7162 length:1755 start_codon:yes stop_codon:yes gene_type:complete